ncbi:thaumatin-like protein 2, partial [Leptotrombidium deliense]
PIQPWTNNGFRLNKNQKRQIRVPCRWEAARIWARTECNADGRNCETGDCNAMKCVGAGQVDVTLAEMTLDGGKNGGDDVYDISAVDAYNLPISIRPESGQKIGQKFGFPKEYDCVTTKCKFDFRNNCPDRLKKWKNGKVTACLSACTATNDNYLCCRKQFNTPQTCQAQNHHLIKYFKDRCPQMYSFAYDDKKSTFLCKGFKGTKYTVTFCP